MKGTFISADFAEDLTGNLRFLELNTDTFAQPNLYSNGNCWDGLTQLISGSGLTGQNITEFHIVYKPSIHDAVVENLSQSLHESASHLNITTYEEHTENLETIYPTSVEDANYKFILRLAYDENAIVDSNYCKDGVEALHLFKDNNDTGSAVPFWSMKDGVIHDGLQSTINSSTLPDVVRKYQASASSVRFGKLSNYYSGSVYYSGSEHDDNRFNTLKNQVSSSTEAEHSYIMNFIYSTASLNEGALSSIRSYHIVYGSTLSVLDVGVVRNYCGFTIPTSSLLPSLDFTQSLNELDHKHYYEFSNSSMKENNFTFNTEGLFETEKFVSSSGELITSTDISSSLHNSESVELKSFHIIGLPDTDSDASYLKWSHEGKTLPSGSYVTSSLVQEYHSDLMNINKLYEVSFEGSTTSSFVGPRSNVLIYDSGSDEVKFEGINKINTSKDGGYFAFNVSGSLVKIEKNELLILNQNTGSFITVDVESNDLFFTSNDGGAMVSFAVHNPPGGFTCFAAGTQISLKNGDVKNIEDIVVGDEVLGWDGESIQSSIVTAIDHRHTVGSHADACKSLGDEPSLYTINDTGIEFTPEHPFLTKDGWKSLVPNPNDEPYKSKQEPRVLQIGDYINKDSEWEEIDTIGIVRSIPEERVYNITVDKLSSYVANGIVVHNKNDGPGQE